MVDEVNGGETPAQISKQSFWISNGQTLSGAMVYMVGGNGNY